MFQLLMIILIVIICGQLMGHVIGFYFANSLKKVKYKWPIGFFAILGIIQLVSFIPGYFYAQVATINIIYTITFISLGLFIIATLLKMSTDQRQAIFRLKKECWLEYLLILGFIFFNFLMCFFTNSLNDTNADQSFYITLVKSNVDAYQINMIDPVSGKMGPLQSIYIYQSFYLLIAYLANIFNIEALLLMGWLVPTLLWISVATTLVNSAYYFDKSSINWKKISVFIILWVLYDHYDFLIRYNVYGNNIRPIVFVYLMMLYNEYFKEMNKGYLFLCGLLWFAGISLQSTTLFLGIMLMISYGIYEIFVHRKNLIVPLVISATPLMIYIAFFMKSRGSWIPTIAILCFLVILPFIKNFLYSKGARVLVGVGLVLMMVISIMMTSILNPALSVSPRELLNFIKEQYLLTWPFNSTWVLVCMKWIILIINVYALFNWRHLSASLKRLLTVQIILVIFFFNPLVCGFISTALTGIVYTRIYEVVIALLVVGAILAYNEENPKPKMINKLLLILAIAFLGLKTKEYLTNDFNKISEDISFNHLYRMEQDMVDISTFLSEDIESNELNHPLVLTTHLQLNYLANRCELVYNVNYSRKLYDETMRLSNPNIYLMYDVLQRSYEIDESQLNEFMGLVNDYGVDYVMTKQDLAPLISDTFNHGWRLIYENSSYRLYKLKP